MWQTMSPLEILTQGKRRNRVFYLNERVYDVEDDFYLNERVYDVEDDFSLSDVLYVTFFIVVRDKICVQKMYTTSIHSIM